MTVLSRKGVTEGLPKSVGVLLLILVIILLDVYIHFALYLCLSKYIMQIYSFQHLHFQCFLSLRIWPVSEWMQVKEGLFTVSLYVPTLQTRGVPSPTYQCASSVRCMRERSRKKIKRFTGSSMLPLKDSK